MYENCEWKGLVHAGHVDYDLNPYSQHSWQFDSFSVTDIEGRSSSANGLVKRHYTSAKTDNFNSWSTDIKRMEFKTEDGVTALTDMVTFFGYGNEGLTPAAYLNGGFIVLSPKTGNQTLTVSTPIAFVNADNEQRQFPVGRLEIRASSDNVIELDTNDTDGNDATVAVRLTINGEMETYTMPWSTWSSTLTFEKDGPGSV